MKGLYGHNPPPRVYKKPVCLSFLYPKPPFPHPTIHTSIAPFPNEPP